MGDSRRHLRLVPNGIACVAAAAVVAVAVVATAACGSADAPAPPSAPSACAPPECPGAVAAEDADAPASPTSALSRDCPDVARAADGTCAGVPPEACADGFAPDGERGCAPILPATPCPDGETAWLGDTACHPIAPCGAGTWGDIPVDDRTIFVDQSSPNGDGDGTRASPFRTIGEAVLHASGGAIVAIAAGTYAENVDIARAGHTTPAAVRLWGVCPSKVTIDGGAGDAIDILGAPASGSEVRGVSLTGRIGLLVIAANDVHVDGVWIHDVASTGLFSDDADGPTAGLSITDTVVARGQAVGVLLDGVAATLDRVVVNDIGPPGGTDAIGLVMYAKNATPSHVVARRVAVARIAGTGVAVGGSFADFTGLLVAQASNDGIDVQGGGTTTLTGAVVTDTSLAGIAQTDGTVSLDACTVRDVHPFEKAVGFVAYAQSDVTGPRASLTVRRSSFVGTFDVGVNALGADLTIDRLAIHAAAGTEFAGIWAESSSVGPPRVSLRSSAVVGAAYTGVAVGGGRADVVGTRIDGVRASTKFGIGDGVVFDGASGTIDGCAVAGAARCAVAVYGGEVDLHASRIDDDAIDLDVEEEALLHLPIGHVLDRGDNACRTGGAAHPCVALSSGFTPPAALPDQRP